MGDWASGYYILTYHCGILQQAIRLVDEKRVKKTGGKPKTH